MNEWHMLDSCKKLLMVEMEKVQKEVKETGEDYQSLLR